MQGRKLITAFCLALCLCVLLSSCGKEEEEPPPPVTPRLTFDWEEEESLPALGVLGENLSGVFAEARFPGDEPVYDEEGNELPSVDPITYVYHELENSGRSAQKYVELLTSPEYAFTIVNAAGKEVEPPNYTKDKGFVVLTRESPNTGKLLRFTVLWEPGICTINLFRLDELQQDIGLEEPGEESPEEVPETSSPPGGPLGAEDVVLFFESLPPAVLGLDGVTMDTYNVYYFDGKVSINDDLCGGVRIYVTSYPEESNAFVGTFFLGINSRRIYKHNMDTDTMTELFL